MEDIITLEPLQIEDREQFVLDNQWAFKHGALIEFGARDNHLDMDGEIISKKTINACINNEKSHTFRILLNGEKVGGVIVKIDNETHRNELEILFVSPNCHSKGIGHKAWKLIEEKYPDTRVWETCTPYFEKRNIHFYLNKCGFQIVEFWNEFNKCNELEGHEDSDGLDEMFKFQKIMKK
ncbi:MAG: GNAT family N-acetyltransferase [Clostridia bacterium]|nr:GNAT family N-acetyltransferase [Clostridia bacterium]